MLHTNERVLYTFVMEYRGGTYMAQVYARGVADALKTWAAALDTAAIGGFSPQRKVELIDDISEELSHGQKPTLLDGLVNAWCTSALTSGGVALINIVATKERNSSPSRTHRKGR
jgi:hypothetical protein